MSCAVWLLIAVAEKHTVELHISVGGINDGSTHLALYHRFRLHNQLTVIDAVIAHCRIEPAAGFYDDFAALFNLERHLHQSAVLNCERPAGRYPEEPS